MNDIPDFLKERTVAQKRKVYKTKTLEPKYEDLDKFSGQQYSRFKDTALTYYRLECKNTDYKQ